MALIPVGRRSSGGTARSSRHRDRRRRAGARPCCWSASSRPVGWDEVLRSTPPRAPRSSSRSSCSRARHLTRFRDAGARRVSRGRRGTKGALSSATAASTCERDRTSRPRRGVDAATGLPFVFAVWAARRARSARRTSGAGRAARERARHRARSSRSAFASERGGDPERYRRYLTAAIRYGLGPRSCRGWRRSCRDGRASCGCAPPTHAPVRGRPRCAPAQRAAHVSLDTALPKRADGGRLAATRRSLLDEQAPLLELGLAADARRRRAPPRRRGHLHRIDRNVNYTNVCTTRCRSAPSTARAATTRATCCRASELGAEVPGDGRRWAASQILLQGGLNPDAAASSWYEDLFRWMKATFPPQPARLSPEEIRHIARHRASCRSTRRARRG